MIAKQCNSDGKTVQQRKWKSKTVLVEHGRGTVEQ